MKRALALLVLVAACGGSSGAEPAGGKASYIGKAEGICKTVNTQLTQAKKELPANTAAVPAYVHRIVDIARTNVTQLSALTPPSADATDLQAKVLGPLKQQLADGDAFAAKVDAATAAKDNAQLTALILHPPTNTRVDLAWMRSYGFSECVKAADTGNAAK